MEGKIYFRLRLIFKVLPTGEDLGGADASIYLHNLTLRTFNVLIFAGINDLAGVIN